MYLQLHNNSINQTKYTAKNSVKHTASRIVNVNIIFLTMEYIKWWHDDQYQLEKHCSVLSRSLKFRFCRTWLQWHLMSYKTMINFTLFFFHCILKLISDIYSLQLRKYILWFKLTLSFLFESLYTPYNYSISFLVVYIYIFSTFPGLVEKRIRFLNVWFLVCTCIVEFLFLHYNIAFW